MPKLSETKPKPVSMTTPTRDAKVKQKAKNVPQSARFLYEQAASGEASGREAIKVFCIECMGYDREAVKECTSETCPLWMYRPLVKHAHRKSRNPTGKNKDS